MATPKKKPEDKLKNGRKSTFTKELGEKICRVISTTPHTLNKICADNPDFPNRECIWGWRLDFPDFANAYDNARRIQADILAEELIEIAFDTRFDTVTKQYKDGSEYDAANAEWIGRSKIKVDTLKWITSKMLPKVYGDKVQNETTVTVKQEDAIKELE